MPSNKKKEGLLVPEGTLQAENDSWVRKKQLRQWRVAAGLTHTRRKNREK